ncbi:MAG: hypothetical protein GXC76_05615 [Rhodanobacteraceae bacterium]|nr:hypothetical protein [Rhodanobacteraceae bacterium]
MGNTYTTNPVTAACTVTATFARNTYTVTPSAGANGTISPITPQTVAHGDTATFTVTPDAGYTAAVGGTCGGSLVGNTYTTNPITAACTVTATFARNTYTVTPSAGANGTISPNSPQTVSHGSTTSFTVTPANGYSASVGGTCGGTLVGTTYTTHAVTADCTVAATFTLNTYTVTPSAGANGVISPATAQTVAHGDTATFTLTPDVGYSASVGGTCGGSLVGNTYTTAPITAACTVTASFARNTYTVTPSAGANGTISPASAQTVAHGDTASFTLTPDAGYHARVDGNCGGALAGTTYTTAPVTADCEVAASFERNRAVLLVLVGGSEQSTQVGQPFAQPLAVRATDVDGVPVPGTVVTFSVASGGAGAVLSSTTATTDRDGIAAVTASANGVSGRHVVTARADGVEMPVRFSLSNLPAAVADAAPVPTLGEAMRALLAMLLVAAAVLAMPRR